MAGIIFSESSALNDPLFGEYQYPIRSIIMQEAESWEQNSIMMRIFAEKTSNHASESYGAMSSMGGFLPVGENADYPNTDLEMGPMKNIRNITWKNSFRISQEMIEDDVVGVINGKPIGFVEGFYRTKEEFLAQMLAKAWAGEKKFTMNGIDFDLTTPDGKCAFAADHKTTISKEAQPNLFSDQFSATALDAASTAMQNTKGERGEILALQPDTIIIPNDGAMKREVMAVIGSEKTPGSNNNDYNYEYGNWNVLISPILNRFVKAGDHPWMLMDSKYVGPHNSMIFQNRKALTVRSEIEHNDANVWLARARFSGGYGNYRGISVGGCASGTPLGK